MFAPATDATRSGLDDVACPMKPRASSLSRYSSMVGQLVGLTWLAQLYQYDIGVVGDIGQLVALTGLTYVHLHALIHSTSVPISVSHNHTRANTLHQSRSHLVTTLLHTHSPHALATISTCVHPPLSGPRQRKPHCTRQAHSGRSSTLSFF
eukprot:SAG31_NODE_369_length_16731_cov_36.453283_8_plen_151_part_00